MSVGLWQVVLILLIVLILFGAGRLPKVMADLAEGLKNFKIGIREVNEEEKKVLTFDAGRPEIADAGLKQDEADKSS
jgi:sec-independent protein translocase protein TatA